MPTLANVQTPSQTASGMVRVHFVGQGSADFSLFWLRDNCPSGFHPQTHERTFDLLTLPDDLALSSATIHSDGGLHLQWAHDGHTSHFAPDWLWAHRPGARRADPADIPPTLWKAADLPDGPPCHDAPAILGSDSALRDWLQDTKRYGLTLVSGIVGAGEASMALARRIGFLRETNFGVTFEVVNMPAPNNLAYTAIELPLHTDLPNQELPPGLQFLHCIANEARGGGSVFADGFAMAQALRAQDPQAFEALALIRVPFRFHDREVDIRVRRPVITLDEDGALREIAYNAHIADLIDLPSGLVDSWYRAYRAYMRLSRDPAFRIAFKMQPGQMAVFDNRRVLHGREAFDPSTGFRHLHGCYVDRGEFDSRLRKLA